MRVTINAAAFELPDAARVADAVRAAAATPPFAVAVNLQFVPRKDYERVVLYAGDAIEIIAPITGG